jgi:hypothetical protein
MYTKENLLARLQNGETVDAIAAEMTEILNSALAEQKILDAKREEEEKAAKELARQEQAKRQAALGIVDAVIDYMLTIGEEEFVEQLREVDSDELIEMLDSMVEMVKALESLKNLEFEVTPKAKKEKKKEPWSADAVIADFLKMFN